MALPTTPLTFDFYISSLTLQEDHTLAQVVLLPAATVAGAPTPPVGRLELTAAPAMAAQWFLDALAGKKVRLTLAALTT